MARGVISHFLLYDSKHTENDMKVVGGEQQQEE
jgi:hypothetical protein